jgi:hypothetical protein
VSLLMRRAGLPARSRGKRTKKPATVIDLARRDFRRSGPDQLWVTDITEHSTREGKVYCCVVIDAWSRRVVGWAIDSRQRADLATSALGMAIDSRHPAAGGIIHGDHGTQFTSWTFTERARKAGLLPSLGTIGDPYDKACVSHCTSWRGLGGNSVSDRASLPCDQPRVAACRWLEEPDVLVVGLVRDEQSGAVPVLDRRLVHAEVCGEQTHRMSSSAPQVAANLVINTERILGVTRPGMTPTNPSPTVTVRGLPGSLALATPWRVGIVGLSFPTRPRRLRKTDYAHQSCRGSDR